MNGMTKRATNTELKTVINESSEDLPGSEHAADVEASIAIRQMSRSKAYVDRFFLMMHDIANWFRPKGNEMSPQYFSDMFNKSLVEGMEVEVSKTEKTSFESEADLNRELTWSEANAEKSRRLLSVWDVLHRIIASPPEGAMRVTPIPNYELFDIVKEAHTPEERFEMDRQSAELRDNAIGSLQTAIDTLKRLDQPLSRQKMNLLFGDNVNTLKDLREMRNGLIGLSGEFAVLDPGTGERLVLKDVLSDIGKFRNGWT